jgi:DNA-binding beta-propeller fold protein YncE
VAVAVNTQTDEAFLLDSNTWSIRIFNRLDNTPAGVARTEPKRVITGPTSGIQYNSHIYVDPKNGDVYTVENDVGDSFSVFAANAGGDAKPLRTVDVGHRGYALAVDEERQEIYVSVESPAAIEVYRKTASGDEKPIRVIQGESTRLSDTHGIAIDPKNRLLFAANWGSVARVSGPDSPDAPSGGRFEPPSITVYPLDANGDAVPLRVIRGTRTQLDWPATMSVDPETGELYVANSVGQSILVFRGNATGDAAPVRTLKGPKTGISYPLGVTIDPKNKELWVANLGNSSATVYPLTASGDVAPLRTIRSAPQGKISLRLGKLNTLAYDSKREEILVPN